jgi:transposase-like protein
MQTEVIVRFKFFRFFVVVAFFFNATAFFASFVFNPFISYAAAVLTLAWLTWCIQCAKCGKSPFVKWSGSLRIGIPIPESKCSKCGRYFLSNEMLKLE